MALKTNTVRFFRDLLEAFFFPLLITLFGTNSMWIILGIIIGIALVTVGSAKLGILLFILLYPFLFLVLASLGNLGILWIVGLIRFVVLRRWIRASHALVM
jgi:hypothetical protein